MDVRRFNSEGNEISDKPPLDLEVSYERTGKGSDWPMALTLIFAIIGFVAVCAIAAWWSR